MIGRLLCSCVRCGRVLLGILLLGGVGVLSACGDEQGAPHALLPDVSLQELDGASRRLSDYRGRILILNFWATWCAPCRYEMPDLQALSEILPPQAFLVAGVNVDRDLNLVREFLLETGVTFLQFQDTDLRLANEVFQVKGYPETLIIDAQGRLLKRISGARAWIEPEFVAYLNSLRDARG